MYQLVMAVTGGLPTHQCMGLTGPECMLMDERYRLSIVFCRCVRPDETSQTLRCHYMRDGTVNVALTIRRAEYFIPAAILLKAFLEVSDLELFRRLAAYAPTDFGMVLPMSASWVVTPKLSLFEIQVMSVCRSLA